MLSRVSLVLECSRVFSLPMTVFSWLVIFVYSITESGKGLYGILALLGICLAHLGTNVIDDYFDYKYLIKQVDFDKKEYLKNSQKTKCRYLISGIMSEQEILILILLYMGFAGLIGLFLYFKCGLGVFYYAMIGGLIALLYPFLSRIRLSEVAVGLAYGPCLFGGVYYVMTKTHSYDAFILSIPTTIMTIILLYIHTVMDFDYDIKEGHKTVANWFNSQLDSLSVLKILLISAYVAPILLCIFDIADWQVFGTYLTIPLALDLYQSMLDFSTDPNSVPEHKWFHYPMEKMEMFKQMDAQAFMTRMYQSRNLMMYYAIALTLGIIFSAC